MFQKFNSIKNASVEEAEIAMLSDEPIKVVAVCVTVTALLHFWGGAHQAVGYVVGYVATLEAKIRLFLTGTTLLHMGQSFTKKMCK